MQGWSISSFLQFTQLHREPDGATMAAVSGERQATTAEFFPAVYGELRRIAAAQLARLAPGQSLQPTALVHEAYLKLAANADTPWSGPRHFFGAAAHAMREIIVDHARHRHAKKRRHDYPPGSLDTAFDLARSALPMDDVVAVDAAIRVLEREHPRKASIVVMRYFGGMSTPQIASALDVTTRTVEREWRFARALLADALVAGRAE
jgi:RNA polymerase sigma factor (TIGR02999 family)